MQYTKGRFTYRAKRELNYPFLVWQEGCTKHRIRDEEDYEQHREYIHNNPGEAGLCRMASDSPYSSAFPGVALDPAPAWLKRKSRG